jgi:hypothetical protein
MLSVILTCYIIDSLKKSSNIFISLRKREKERNEGKRIHRNKSMRKDVINEYQGSRRSLQHTYAKFNTNLAQP